MDYRYMPFYVQGSALSGMYYQPWDDVEVRDLEYLKEMYPKTIQKIQQLIEEECDRQEYEGSFLYDQYPDKLGVMQIVNRMYDKARMESPVEEQEVGDDRMMKDLITILLLNEMYRRRTTRRRRRKYFMGNR